MNAFYNIDGYNDTFYFSKEDQVVGRESIFGQYIAAKDAYVKLVLVPGELMYVSIATGADQTGVTVSVNGGTFDTTSADATNLYSSDVLYDTATTSKIVVKFPDLSDHSVFINSPVYDTEVTSLLDEQFYANIVPGYPERISMSLSLDTPPLLCNPSMFCVTHMSKRPARSSRATAWCTALGSASRKFSQPSVF